MTNSTVMLMLHFWNISYFENENREWYSFVMAYLYVETVIYVIDVFNMMFYIWLIFKAAQFHYNFNFIVGFFLGTHLFHDFAILTYRFVMITTPDFNQIDPSLTRCCINISLYSMGAALSCLPFFMLERCCATYYLSDYELNNRHHISYLITFTQFLIGSFTCYSLQDENNTFIVVGALCCLNVVAIAILILLILYNNRKFKSFHEGLSQYSLAMRFQISENIKCLTMITKMILYMGLMNSILVLVMLMSSYHLSNEFRFISAVAMDICIFAYAFSIPQIMTMCSDKWQAQLRRTLRCFSNPTRLTPLRDSYGVKMDQTQSTDDHFETLKTVWEARIA